MSKLWAHLGTVLALLASGGADFGAWHVPTAVQAALTAVAGLLVACHVLTVRQATSAEHSIDAFAGRVGQAVELLVHQQPHPTTPAAGQAGGTIPPA